jgi:SAM-dependent methyltransferase
VHEILDHLPPGARVLDLGARGGSFQASDYPHLIIVSADLAPSAAHRNPVMADAAALPFASRAFHAVIANHSLEHFERFKPALQEIGRVVRSDGAVFVAVPDAGTFGDRLYRKLLRDRGGHVNLFGSEPELIHTLSWYFGMPLAGSRGLENSFVWLNRHNANGAHIALPEPMLRVFVSIMRTLGNRFSRYGWALYFGNLGEPVDPTVRTNVCIRCGAACERSSLPQGRRTYSCTQCGARNITSPE